MHNGRTLERDKGAVHALLGAGLTFQRNPRYSHLERFSKILSAQPVGGAEGGPDERPQSPRRGARTSIGGSLSDRTHRLRGQNFRESFDPDNFQRFDWETSDCQKPIQ
jgi:hypothetical protein